jgi:hypothetical protein
VIPLVLPVHGVSWAAVKGTFGFHFGGIDVLAARNDDVLQSVHNGHEAFVAYVVNRIRQDPADTRAADLVTALAGALI